MAVRTRLGHPPHLKILSHNCNNPFPKDGDIYRLQGLQHGEIFGGHFSADHRWEARGKPRLLQVRPIRAEQSEAYWSRSPSLGLEAEVRLTSPGQRASDRTKWTPLTDRPGLAGWRCRQVTAGLGNSAIMFQCCWMFSRCCGICLIYFCGRAVSHIPVQGCVMKRTWDNTSVIFFYMCLFFTHVERYWKSCSRYLPRIPALTCSTLENFISKKSAHAPPQSGPSVVHGAALGQHWDGTLHHFALLILVPWLWGGDIWRHERLTEIERYRDRERHSGDWQHRNSLRLHCWELVTMSQGRVSSGTLSILRHLKL